MAATPAVLAVTGPNSLEMSRRLERRFRCIGIQQLVLSDAQARLLAAGPGARVVLTAWTMDDQPGAAEAMQLFVGARDGFCAPGSLRGAFGSSAVLGPVFDAAAFFPPTALFAGGKPSAPTPVAAPAAAATAPKPATPVAAAPAPAAAPASAAAAAAGGKGKAKVDAAVAVPAKAALATTAAAAATPPPPPLVKPHLPPLATLAITRTPAGSSCLVQLSISAVRPLVELSFSAGALRITPCGLPPGAAAGTPPPPQQQRAMAPAGPTTPGAPAVPLTGGHFRSATQSAAMVPALRRGDRAGQYAFHSGRVPWHVAVK